MEYHEQGRPGKIEVIPTKPYSTQRDLSLAYSPGVAEPCIAIHERPADVYKYTAKGNLVAVISNGTAVLGLGDLGPMASKPVMEGKGLLFKIFADIDVFDIEVDVTDPDEFIRTVKNIAPTFGGINLEDIKAPEAFEIEERLKNELDIPVMHDDQHGTAIITAAALINALDITEKNAEDVKVVVSGAGASAISCGKLFLSCGVRKENMLFFDSKGAITQSREGLTPEKQFFASDRPAISLDDAMKGADVFLGLSRGGVVSADMLKSMGPKPIVFALANPDPEIDYNVAIETRSDIIMATGRSDNPNQVNNVLGFPFIFRGALDVQATAINEEMKVAAAKAIADLARENVPEDVNEAYGEKNLHFGTNYIIPKPLDPRLITVVAPAVAKAAIDSGVARATISDWDAYKTALIRRMGKDNTLMRTVTKAAQRGNLQKVVFAEGDNYKVLKAAQIVRDEGICEPILLGRIETIKALIEEYKLDLEGVEMRDPKVEEEDENRNYYAQTMYEKRNRSGITLVESKRLMRERNYYGGGMVVSGEADALISGLTRSYPDTIKPAMHVIGREMGINRIAGMYIMHTKSGPMFFADTTVNRDPSAEALVDITLLAARAVRKFNVVPKIAMLSYSNFGSAYGENPDKVKKAVSILHKEHPDLIVDGEIQANFALNKEKRQETFPFSSIANQDVNTLIFPSLASGNIAYKLMQEMQIADAVGPILLGMDKPVHILQRGCSIREIVELTTIAVYESHLK